jgi:hypothetical protein
VLQNTVDKQMKESEIKQNAIAIKNQNLRAKSFAAFAWAWRL